MDAVEFYLVVFEHEDLLVLPLQTQHVVLFEGYLVLLQGERVLRQQVYLEEGELELLLHDSILAIHKYILNPPILPMQLTLAHVAAIDSEIPPLIEGGDVLEEEFLEVVFQNYLLLHALEVDYHAVLAYP